MFFLLLFICGVISASEQRVLDLLTIQPNKPAWQQKIEFFEKSFSEKLGALELKLNKKLESFDIRITTADQTIDEILKTLNQSDDRNHNLYRMAMVKNAEIAATNEELAKAVSSLIPYVKQIEALEEQLKNCVTLREFSDRMQHVVPADRFNTHTHTYKTLDDLSPKLVEQKTSMPN